MLTRGKTLTLPSEKRDPVFNMIVMHTVLGAAAFIYGSSYKKQIHFNQFTEVIYMASLFTDLDIN